MMIVLSGKKAALRRAKIAVKEVVVLMEQGAAD